MKHAAGIVVAWGLFGSIAGAQPRADAPCADWRDAERSLLREHVQLTSRERFLKAGEAYFDHESPPKWIIFQAIPVPAKGEAAQPFYSMYVARLKYESGESGGITGIEEPVRVSPDGAANTCGWFVPGTPTILFASTLGPPSETAQPGYQRGSGRYRWEFPREMRIVRRNVRELMPAPPAPPEPGMMMCGNEFMPMEVVGDGEGYVAEGALSPDGRLLVYSKMIDATSKNLDIFIRDMASGVDHAIVAAPGYDGGPFFSPDGKRVCFRSDRVGNDLLQVYVADLKFDESGAPIGVAREHAITDNAHVNWGPYWHPSGAFVVYATSEMGHGNYEVFAAEVPAMGETRPAAEIQRRRVTTAAGADVLPVFSDDGEYMMWTSQRGPKAEGEERSSSQVWVARVQSPAAFFAKPE